MIDTATATKTHAAAGHDPYLPVVPGADAAQARRAPKARIAGPGGPTATRLLRAALTIGQPIGPGPG